MKYTYLALIGALALGLLVAGCSTEIAPGPEQYPSGTPEQQEAATLQGVDNSFVNEEEPVEIGEMI